MSVLDKAYNPKETEEKIYQNWEKSGFFNPDKLKTKNKKTFTIVVPPPNITGSLHMGHALNATIQDILIRKKRMEGNKTLWVPGTDHAGIATQYVVEKELKKEGLTRHDLGREKFLERVWQWKEKYGNTILEQFKKLGSSMDWSRTRFTMDQKYQKAVSAAFLHYYKKGWIYKAEKVVSWCTRCATSLSDLELEHKEEDTTLFYIKYPFAAGGGHVTVATVRPETLLGDTAIAVNPKDKRYKHLAGQKVLLPIQKREIPVIADPSVEMEFGTGVVKVTPAHDVSDAEIAARHKLESITIINERGRMTEKAGKEYEGLKTVEARQKIVEALKIQNLLVQEEPYTHNIATCYRCGTIIEPLPALQWFLKMGVLASRALKTVKSGKVRFFPKRWEKIYFDWLTHIRDWPLSRQLWWGHQLPVYFCQNKNKQEAISNFQFPISKQTQNQKSKIEENFIVSEKKPETCPFCKNCSLEQATDVLDTWFSSALWPFATLGWPLACAKSQRLKVKSQNHCKLLHSSDLESFYPTQVLSTARDIINLWVARMVYSGLEFMGKEPFRDVVIHATILTKDGRRMSKSLGTGIDPVDLIARYGADATRFGLVWQVMGNQDIHWSEEHVNAGRKFANKIWNASRFVLQNVNSKFKIQSSKLQVKNQNLTTVDKKILQRLKKITQSMNKKIDTYDFGQALHDLYDFFWHDFCDQYIESAKKQLNEEQTSENTKTILLKVLADSLKLLHPFMPFVTEEIWSHMPTKNKKMLIIESWPRS